MAYSAAGTLVKDKSRRSSVEKVDEAVVKKDRSEDSRAEATTIDGWID